MAKTNALAVIQPEQSCDMSLASGGDYLRRIKLCTALTAEVKEKKAEADDFYLTGVENLGKEVAVVPCKARPHALRLIEASSKVGGESFDTNDPLFQEIKRDRDADPSCQDPNNMYGYDFLLWLPDTRQFATIFLCKMALWKSVPSFTKLTGRLAVMAAREERSKKNTKITYMVPGLTLADDQAYDAPTAEEYQAAVAKFDNPRAQTAGDDAEPQAATVKPTAKKGGKKGR